MGPAAGHTPFADGEEVDHYRVVRSLGRGGMGEVFLARDTELGRRVALKAIHPQLLGSDREVSRFLFEARATARFSHPHIVTIFGVGQHRDIPYMALEYLEGGTLRGRMRGSRMGEREAIRVALAIAEALEESHAHGVTHGDLKPNNVVIPRDGRIRVLDFGLARIVSRPTVPREHEDDLEATDDDDEGTYGSPEYMAPEQWLGAETGAPADVWSLGVILFEMLAGRRPYTFKDPLELGTAVASPDPAPDLDLFRPVRRPLASLVAICLRKAAADRPTAGELASRLRDLLASEGGSTSTREESPFRGLRPFGERHAPFFHGREAELDALIEQVRRETVLPVVGPSGAGKSSFVQAGVIPRLREQGRWLVLNVLPGRRPFVDLETVLDAALTAETPEAIEQEPATISLHLTGYEIQALVEPGAEKVGPGLADRLREAPEQLNLVLQQIAEHNDARVLLFVDQLEELYTLGDDPRLQRNFMRAICTAADDPQGLVRVVFTVRDDFLGRLHQDDVVRQVLSRVTVLQRPDAQAMAEMLQRPLQTVGFQADDPALIPEMVEAVRDEPACLPLLQFTARALWDRRDRERRVLRRSVYDEMGGVAGALARHADGVVDSLFPTDVRLARQILLRLVTTEGTRQVLPVDQVLEGMDPRARQVLGRLAEARLVTVRKAGSASEGEAELQLVHESLIRSWKRLARWIDHSREELALLEQLVAVAELWDKRGRRDEELWHGAHLDEASRTLTEGETVVPERVTAFLAAGQLKDRRLRNRRRALIGTGVGLLALIAAVSLVVAWVMADKERETQRQKEVAETQRAEAQREGARAAFERGGVLEARAKLRASLETEDSLLARALWSRIGAAPLLWSRELGTFAYKVAWSPDGRTLAAACQDRSLYLFDVRTGAVRILRGHAEQVSAVAFSPDGSHLASGSWDATVRVWDLGTGESTAMAGHGDRVTDVRFHPGGNLLASASNDRSVKLWKVGERRPSATFGGAICRNGELDFSPDGGLLATGDSDGDVHLMDVASRAEVRTFRAHERPVGTVRFSPDGASLVTRDADQRIRIWRLSDRTLTADLAGHTRQVTGLGFLADGRLVSASTDQTVRLWDTATGTSRILLSGDEVASRAASLSPNGRFLGQATFDKVLRVWDLDASGDQPTVAGGHTDAIYAVAFSPDDRTVYTGSLDNTVRAWDVVSGRPLARFEGHTHGVCGVATSPDGTRVASGSIDGTVRVWDTASGEALATLTGHTDRIWGVAISPDGTRVASASSDSTVRLWDLASGAELLRIPCHAGGATTVSFSPDGSRIATSGLDPTPMVWDAITGRRVQILDGHEGEVLGVAFSSDGRTVASGGFDGTLRLWDVASGEGRVLGRHEGRIHGIAFDPAGRRLLTSCSDGSARVWSVADGSHVELAGHAAEVNNVAFSHDGMWVATGGDGGTVRLWDAATGAPVWLGVALVPRSLSLLTHEGWAPLRPTAPPPPMTEWAAALDARATYASLSDDGSLVCMATADGIVEIWDAVHDHLHGRVELPGWDRLIAVSAGCLVLAGGEASLRPIEGPPVVLSTDALASAADDEGVLVASRTAVQSFDPAGTPGPTTPIGPGIAAVDRRGGELVLGFADGNIEVRNEGSDRADVHFEDTVSSPVIHLAAGPMHTIAAGHANGQVGLWSAVNGELLTAARLHGPVDHLAVSGSDLVAATGLGDHLWWDLGHLTVDRCDLLKDVWNQVPVVWEGGLPVVRDPPPDHACLRGSGRGTRR